MTLHLNLEKLFASLPTLFNKGYVFLFFTALLIVFFYPQKISVFAAVAASF